MLCLHSGSVVADGRLAVPLAVAPPPRALPAGRAAHRRRANARPAVIHRAPHFGLNRLRHRPFVFHGRGCHCSDCRLGFIPFLEYYRPDDYDHRSRGSGGPARNPLFRNRADRPFNDDAWQGPPDSLRQSRLNIETALLSGRVLLRQGRYRQATNDYLEAVLINGKDGQGEAQLTIAALMAGNYDLAAWAVRRTLEPDPAHILAMSDLMDLIADAPDSENELRRRLSDLQYMLEDDPLWIDGWILLATHRHLLDDPVAAQLALQIAQLHAEQDQLPDQLLEVLVRSVGP